MVEQSITTLGIGQELGAPLLMATPLASIATCWWRQTVGQPQAWGRRLTLGAPWSTLYLLI